MSSLGVVEAPRLNRREPDAAERFSVIGCAAMLPRLQAQAGNFTGSMAEKPGLGLGGLPLLQELVAKLKQRLDEHPEVVLGAAVVDDGDA